jgi:integrase
MAKRNSFYNESIYAQVHKESKSILGDYILEMKSKRKSEKTVYQYTADIKMFYCWAFNELDNKSILKMKKRDFRRFFLELQENGSSTSRINRVQCSVRNLLEFCTNDDDEYEDYDINAMKAIKGLAKEEVREIHFLTDEQITIILDYLIAKKQFQKALYVSLSYDSAGRRNEVFQVLKKDFLDSKKTNEVKGKRGKKFKLMYLSRTREIAKMYFEQRGEDKFPEMWIVGKEENRRPAQYETLYNWTVSFRKILEKETGETIQMNPHSFRHSSLENYENGSHFSLKEMGLPKLELKVLKVLANHSDLSTTQSYLKNKDEELLGAAFGL